MRGMDVIFPMPLDFFGSSGLDTKASQSQAFLKKGQLLLSGGKGDKKNLCQTSVMDRPIAL